MLRTCLALSNSSVIVSFKVVDIKFNAHNPYIGHGCIPLSELTHYNSTTVLHIQSTNYENIILEFVVLSVALSCPRTICLS